MNQELVAGVVKGIILAILGGLLVFIIVKIVALGDKDD